MKRNQTVRIRLLALLGALFLIILGACVVSAYTAEELVSISSKIQNETPGIKFDMWTDNSTYQMGEKVVFGFTADQDCYLSLIDIGTSGKTLIIFPNRWHPENKIQKGKTYTIPPEGAEYVYRVGGPVGKERIKAIASLEPIMVNVQSLQEELKRPLEKKPESDGIFLGMKDPLAVMKDISMEVSKLDPKKWATAELTFEVREQAGTAAPSESKPSSETEKPR